MGLKPCVQFVCTCMFFVPSSRRTHERQVVAPARRPQRRRLPRGRRHLDDGRRPPLDPRGARDVHGLAAVGRQRVRARLRRLRAPRRPRRRPRRPAAAVPRRAHRVPGVLGARRARPGGLGARRRPLRHRPERGVHDAGRAVDHHDELRRGPGTQPGAAVLRRLRRRRLLDGPRARWAARRRRLALGLLRAGRPRRAAHGARGPGHPARHAGGHGDGLRPARARCC